jgi:hypothetical protein
MLRYQRGHAVKDSRSQHTLHLTSFNASVVFKEDSVWNNEEAMQHSISVAQAAPSLLAKAMMRRQEAEQGVQKPWRL